MGKGTSYGCRPWGRAQVMVADHGEGHKLLLPTNLEGHKLWLPTMGKGTSYGCRPWGRAQVMVADHGEGHKLLLPTMGKGTSYGCRPWRSSQVMVADHGEGHKLLLPTMGKGTSYGCRPWGRAQVMVADHVEGHKLLLPTNGEGHKLWLPTMGKGTRYANVSPRRKKKIVQCQGSGEKHLCSVCGQEFQKSDSLKKHEMSHHQTGSEQSQTHCCHVCAKRFTQKSSLNQHFKIHMQSYPASNSLQESAATDDAGHTGRSRPAEDARTTQRIPKDVSVHYLGSDEPQEHQLMLSFHRICFLCCDNSAAHCAFATPLGWQTEVVNKTAEVVNKTAGIVNKTTGVVNKTADVVNKTAGIVNKTAEVVNKTAGIVNKTDEVVNKTAGIVNKTAGVVNKTAAVVNKTAAVVNNTAEVVNKTAGIVNKTAGVVNKTAEDPSYSCDICGHSFHRKDVYDRHMSTHSGQRPYSCAHCGKAFTFKSNLSAHLATHPGFSQRKELCCNDCGKLFKHKSSFNLHSVGRMDCVLVTKSGTVGQAICLTVTLALWDNFDLPEFDELGFGEVVAMLQGGQACSVVFLTLSGQSKTQSLDRRSRSPCVSSSLSLPLGFRFLSNEVGCTHLLSSAEIRHLLHSPSSVSYVELNRSTTHLISFVNSKQSVKS
ncbi:hypothetical protein PR048_018737 [Dryococelus australis]|uniref:C2H2-type domain-containing protein n=1 Tax=Dryococelus australis TaxID=614101 RepID=A0ABQ9HDB5_9NEOP|nr:hypothetical protein PR048_018737 [Dryococelus australis]